MYGINEKVYNNLLEYFKSNSNIKKVILFGSRAKGNEKINSDIDLAIECTSNSKSDILDKVDDIVGIYSVDIVFMDALNIEIQDQIYKYGVEIFNNKKASNF